jgi:hypothetical protein
LGNHSGRIENRRGDYFEVPIETGAGAGLLAQAPKLSVLTAKTANAAILMNFMNISPPFLAGSVL